MTGTVNNGQRVEVDFSFYKGRAGMTGEPDGVRLLSMIADRPTGSKVPTEGTIEGEKVDVISIARSDFDRRFVVIAVRAQAAG